MNSPRFAIRLACNDISRARAFYKKTSFNEEHFDEKNKRSWQTDKGLVLCLQEGQQNSPALTIYPNDVDKELDRLDELGIVMNYEADAEGNNFEATFSDPAGNALIIADHRELPQGLYEKMGEESPLKELSLPGVAQFIDSMNFWLALGFEVQPAQAQPHPWAVFKAGNISVGIHQSELWKQAGLCFHKAQNPYKLKWEQTQIKVYSHVDKAAEICGCAIYQLP